MSGTSGDDSLLGTAADDKIVGKAGDDTIDGGAGDDTLIGSIGNDLLIGGLGNDLINTGSGPYEDTIDAGSGNDTIIASGGQSTITGGAGGDLFSLRTADQSVEITDFSIGDQISLAGIGIGSLNALTTWVTGGDTYIEATSGGATALIVLKDVKLTLTGKEFRFALNKGSSGNDIFTGDTEDTNTYYGQGGHDHITGGFLDDFLRGGDGDDRIMGLRGDDLLSGGAGRDTLSGGDNHDTLHGGDGEDRLFGATGDDVANGDDGDDMLIATTGDDTLTGGNGADTFSFWEGGGHHTVTDFEVGNDVFETRISSVTTFSDITQTSVGADLVVTLGSATTVTFEGLALSPFDAADITIL